MTSLIWINPDMLAVTSGGGGGGASAFSFTFTNMNTTGIDGPPNTATYGTNPTGWGGVTNGIQSWTVPSTGTYQIVAAGAGTWSNWTGLTGGRGVVISTTVTLTAGHVIKILVGQQSGMVGAIPTFGGGGGGGTFVINSTTSTIILIAGGGGNPFYSGANYAGGDAVVTTSGATGRYGAGGTNGGGGTNNQTTNDINEGAGYSGDAVNTGTSTKGAKSYTNGGRGGIAFDANGPNGGFGGGGTIGGGGGYSGGGGIDFGQQGWGGGGGSYDINGTGKAATLYKSRIVTAIVDGYNTGPGMAIISTTYYIASSLLAYYDFSNTLSYSGSGTTLTNIASSSYTMTLANTGTYVSTIPKYMTWNTNSNGSVACSATFTSFTYEMLLQYTSAAGGPSLFTYGNDSNALLNMYINPSQQLGLGVNGGGGSGSRFATQQTLAFNTWYHLCISYTNSTTIAMYINGVAQTTNNGTVIIPSAASYTKLVFGTFLTTSSNSPPGKMVMGRFYTNALSAAEVTQNYTSIKANGNPYGI